MPFLFCYYLFMTQTATLGTAAYYDKHIYTNLHETVGLGLDATPSTTVAWVQQLGIIPTDTSCTILEVGCGAGRNLKAISETFPKAQLYGFDGSPLAISIASQGLPDVTLRVGNMFDTWPFEQQFDIIFDITASIPESLTEEALDSYTTTLFQTLKPGGYAIIEAISPNDQSSRRFGDGKVVTWVHGEDTKTERLMDLPEAKTLYEKHGFKIFDSRIEQFEATAFGSVVQREFIQLVIRKP